MKEWTIKEFLKECEDLSRNMYTYDYSKMPDGVCNGHTVRISQSSWHSVIIDDCIVDLGSINERFPKGSVCYQVDRTSMTGLEFVEYRLME